MPRFSTSVVLSTLVLSSRASVDAKEFAARFNVSVFRMHEHPSPECPIGRNVHAVLGKELNAAEQAMLERLDSTTLADLADTTRERIAQQEQA